MWWFNGWVLGWIFGLLGFSCVWKGCMLGWSWFLRVFSGWWIDKGNCCMLVGLGVSGVCNGGWGGLGWVCWLVIGGCNGGWGCFVCWIWLLRVGWIGWVLGVILCSWLWRYCLKLGWRGVWGWLGWESWLCRLGCRWGWGCVGLVICWLKCWVIGGNLLVIVVGKFGWLGKGCGMWLKVWRRCGGWGIMFWIGGWRCGWVW